MRAPYAPVGCAPAPTTSDVLDCEKYNQLTENHSIRLGERPRQKPLLSFELLSEAVPSSTCGREEMNSWMLACRAAAMMSASGSVLVLSPYATLSLRLRSNSTGSCETTLISARIRSAGQSRRSRESSDCNRMPHTSAFSGLSQRLNRPLTIP